MLHAVVGKKSSRWRKDARAIILDTQEKRERRHIPREDEIASTVFGAMRYLKTVDVHRFFFALIEDDSQKCFKPFSHELTFWPSRWHTWKNNEMRRTEPDIVVDFKNENGLIIERLIIELKWGSSFGDDQLEREWNAFQEKDTRLIYLANVIDAEFYEKRGAVGKSKWFGLTWQDFLGCVKKGRRNDFDETFIKYLIDLSNFFDVLDICVFDKFPLFDFENDFYINWSFS